MYVKASVFLLIPVGFVLKELEYLSGLPISFDFTFSNSPSAGSGEASGQEPFPGRGLRPIVRPNPLVLRLETPRISTLPFPPARSVAI